jgi:adenylate kinase family enzyme
MQKGLVHVAMSTLLMERRAQLPAFEEAWGEKMDGGFLLPDKPVIETMRSFFDTGYRPDADYAFDGIIRSVAQARWSLDHLLHQRHECAVLFFRMPKEACIERVKGRVRSKLAKGEVVRLDDLKVLEGKGEGIHRIEQYYEIEDDLWQFIVSQYGPFVSLVDVDACDTIENIHLRISEFRDWVFSVQTA